MENKYVCVEDGQVKDFTPARENPVSIEVVFADDTLSLAGVDNSNILGTDPRFESLFVGYPREIDGDYMRGRVGLLTLQSLSNVSEGFELHAINVDYEYSGLDT